MPLIELGSFSPPPSGCAVCLGTFDGVHLGHQALLRETARAAREKGLLPCAYTFDMPPAGVLGGRRTEVLTEIGEKADLMAAHGVTTCVYSLFDERVAACGAEEFFEQTLLRKLNARFVVIGFHYRFGRFARGDALLMRALCEKAGIGLTVVPPVCLADGQVISSTAIRACLLRGDRRGAETMLNRPLTAREEGLLGGM
ncbi:MAG: FAD synthetase family protein [Clostridia bacterium]|nr:FAD synthetase family protein [Clostridia bacterium]